MNTSRIHSIPAVVIFLCTTLGLKANIVYSTDFNSPTYSVGAINGQNGWFNSSANTPGNGSIIANIFNTSDYTQLNTLVLGGQSATASVGTQPDWSGVTSVLHSANTGNNSVAIKSTFNLAVNDVSTATATFGYSVFSTTGITLMNILFTPTLSDGKLTYSLGIQSAANDNPTYPLEIQAVKFPGNPALFSPNTFYTMDAMITGIGTGNQNTWGTIVPYSDFSSTTTPGGSDINFSNALTPPDSEGNQYPIYPSNDGNTQVGYVGISWVNLDASGNYLPTWGDNSIVVKDLSVSDIAAVPESSQIAASLLLMSGIAGFMLIRHRKVSASVVS